MLTGNAQLLEPYRTAPALLAEQEAVLRGALVDRPEPARQVDAVLRAHREWLAAAEPAVGLRAAGRQAELDALVAASPGVPLFAELRRQTAQLRSMITDQVVSEETAAVTVRDTLSWVLLGVAVAALAAAALAVAGIRRAVTRPLGALVDSVERVADGELELAVPAGGPPELAGLGVAVDRMRLRLNEHRRSEVPAAELRESDRVAADLRDGAVRRLFGISTGLVALRNRYPDLAGPLSRPIDELDRAIGEVRAAATGATGATKPPGRALSGRVDDVLAAVPDRLGVHPDLRLGAASREVPPAAADALVGALAGAVDGLVATRARLDALEVELAVTATTATLSVTARGVVAGEWVRDLRARAAAGECRVVDLDPELTGVEWCVELAAP